MLKVKVEDSKALRFIFRDELYLLDEDKKNYSNPAETIPEVVTPPAVFNYTGGNKKRFLLVAYYPGHDFMPDAHLAALESTLGRMGYGREDVAILNLAGCDADHQQLIGHFQPSTLVYLGSASLPDGAGEIAFNVIENMDGIRILYTHSFDDMMNDVAKKKAFWEQMKNL
ncbi:MAG TPA: hypothetical protein VHC47_10900 [Mucilaginibacter sp.]|nr:hypothetical protein [Mucilaginibacter sp.]